MYSPLLCDSTIMVLVCYRLYFPIMKDLTANFGKGLDHGNIIYIFKLPNMTKGSDHNFIMVFFFKLKLLIWEGWG